MTWIVLGGFNQVSSQSEEEEEEKAKEKIRAILCRERGKEILSKEICEN